MSLHFEDFTAGRRFQSPQPRPVTAQTIAAFAELSGDKNRLHLDEDFARKTAFGGRIAHGLLGLSIASGLLHDMGIVADTIMAFTGLDWKFKAPARDGDRLSLSLAVAKTRALGKRGGLVIFAASLSNQKGEVLQEGDWSLMVQRRD